MIFRRSRLALVILSSISLGACAHEEEHVTTLAMPAHYALQSQQGAEEVTMPGHVSRYQREMIVSGGAEPMSECGKNFSQIMDHLETLMAPQIEANNQIAAQQAANPAFTF